MSNFIDFKFLKQALLFRGTYALYGTYTLIILTIISKMQGTVVDLSYSVLFIFPFLLTLPVVYCNYKYVSKSWKQEKWANIAFYSYVIWTCFWSAISSFAVEKLIVYAIILFMGVPLMLVGSEIKKKIHIYWGIYAVCYSLGRIINNKFDLFYDTMLVLTLLWCINVYRFLLDNLKLQIDKNRRLLQNSREDNYIIRQERKKIEEKSEELIIEKDKSDRLLLNVLPESIATRLKEGETTIADHFSEASVIFIDIADFTKLSAKSSPQAMVKMLNDIFTIFDKIAAKYGLEKIKTIGDCYMAAAGIPIPRKDHAEAISMMALEVMETMKDYRVLGSGIGGLEDGSEVQCIVSGEIEIGEQSPIPRPPSPDPRPQEIQFRIGLDCGPIVAGVIGEQKFIYDLWGDMVNTASRMETNGVVGRIQCTERFKDVLHLPDVGHLFNFEERGEIEIKGKGMMKTYFINQVNP
ncbi:MAG: adenylate/guanylate cyclase with and sensor [Ignavibacteria bacterium]|nr:adenylate/guanylate cyclase with and sensor [Ignavibacteria bacterium]